MYNVKNQKSENNKSEMEIIIVIEGGKIQNIIANKLNIMSILVLDHDNDNEKLYRPIIEINQSEIIKVREIYGELL